MRRLLIRFWLAALLLLTCSRLLLVWWQWPRMQDNGNLLATMLGGLRIDLSTLGMLTLIPALLAPWLGHRYWPTRITAWWLRLCTLLLVLLEAATPQFIIEYDLRPNRLFIEYLVHPHEVAAMLWQGYKPVLLYVLVLLASAGYAAWRWLPVQPDAPLPRIWQRALASVMLLVICFAAVRGTLAHRPLNAAMVAYSNDALINALTLNSLYNVGTAAYQLRDDRIIRYGEMPEARMQELVRRAAQLEAPPIQDELPSLHEAPAAITRNQPLNLVIVVQESLGAPYVGALDNPAREGIVKERNGITPELDQLIHQGWAFTNLYATGTRSARGLEAITAGFLPSPALPALKLSKAQHGFFTLADLLDRHGYHSRFIYGGEAHFDNMRSFFLGNGFQEIVDLPKFNQPAFVGTWGASDEDMFNELHALLMKDGNKPTFTVAFSVSNHTPWEYPAGRIEPIGAPASNVNAVRYADWAMGQFFKQARNAPYWSHTLFLVVADHDAKVFGADNIPLAHFHIPAVILGADVAPRRDDRLASQADLAPTLLSLMGLTTTHPMLGMDLNTHTPDRAMMQYDDRYGYLQGNQLVVLSPGQPAQQFSVSHHTLAPSVLNPALAELALAHSLWPVWAYQNERYRLPPPAVSRDKH